MVIRIRCHSCGQTVIALDRPGRKVRCPSCRAKLVVPRVLARLPHPNVPGRSADGPEPGRRAMPDREAKPADEVAARALPWILSLLLHVGLAFVLAFVVMLTLAKPPDSHEMLVVRAGVGGGSLEPRGPLVQPNPDCPGPTRQPPRRPDGPIAEEIAEGQPRIVLPGLPDPDVDPGRAPGPGGGGLFPPGLPGGAPATHIVFVIDRSGSMVDTFHQVSREIALSVGSMTAEQRFHVVLFSDGAPLEKPPRKLVCATEKHKLRLGAFLGDIRAFGRTDPLPALRRAFEVLPADRQAGKLVHLLTDGVFPDNEKVLAAIRRMNPDKDVCINTYLYGQRPPAAEAVLKKIAFENGGRYNYVCPDQ